MGVDEMHGVHDGRTWFHGCNTYMFQNNWAYIFGYKQKKQMAFSFIHSWRLDRQRHSTKNILLQATNEFYEESKRTNNKNMDLQVSPPSLFFRASWLALVLLLNQRGFPFFFITVFRFWNPRPFLASSLGVKPSSTSNLHVFSFTPPQKENPERDLPPPQPSFPWLLSPFFNKASGQPKVSPSFLASCRIF